MSGPSSPSPLVSIITPCHNYARYLRDMIAGLQAQTCEDWECLIVDDGSTDDTAAVSRDHARRDPRIRCVSQENRGPSAARNNGLHRAAGRYVQFLDADDRLEAEKLERHAEFLQRHPDVDLVYGDVGYFETAEPERLFHTMFGEGAKPPLAERLAGQALVRALLHGNPFVINAPLLRRALVAEVGDFREDMREVEDWEYWLRCALAGKTFAHLAAPGTRALVRSHAASLSKNRLRMHTAVHALRRTLAESLPDESELRAINRRLALANEASLGIQEGLHGDRRGGARRLLRVGLAARAPKWVLYAAALPLLVSPRLRPLIDWSKGRLRRPTP